jgi:hypothetical protein
MISSRTPTCMKAHEAAKQPDQRAGTCTKAHEGPLREAQNGPACPPPADPEQALVAALARAVAACRDVGQDHAARVAWRALDELLAQPGRNASKVAALDLRSDNRETRGNGRE